MCRFPDWFDKDRLSKGERLGGLPTRAVRKLPVTFYNSIVR